MKLRELIEKLQMFENLDYGNCLTVCNNSTQAIFAVAHNARTNCIVLISDELGDKETLVSSKVFDDIIHKP